MTEKAVKPEIRFAGFNDAWEQRKLGEVLTSLQNNTLSRADLSSEQGIAKNVHYGDILVKFGEVIDVKTESLPLIADEAVIAKYKSSFLQNGDVIVADTAEDETVGKCTEIAGLGDEIVISGLHTIPYRPVRKFASGYLGYYMNSVSFHNQLLPLMQGIKVTSISKTALQNTDIIYPKSATEQEAIGKYFCQLDNLITLHQRKYDKLTKVKKSMLEKMFPKNGANVPEIRFKGFSDAWEQRKLGEMGQTYTGLSGKTKDDFGHGQARFVTYMNVFSNPISNPEMTEPIEIDPKQNEVEVGDVFFTTSSETPEEVGMSSILLEKRGKTYLNSFCFGFRPSEKIDSYYLAYMLRSESARAKITLLAQGISRYNISKNKVMEIAVSLPSLDEQKMIGQYFSQLDNLITLHQRELEKLKNIKKACLEKMFV